MTGERLWEMIAPAGGPNIDPGVAGIMKDTSAKDDDGRVLSGENDPVVIELGMMAAVCPICDEPREPGLCPECGTEVPVSEEVAPGVKARKAALAGLPERLANVATGFEDLPPGAIPLSNDQFATVVDDVQLFDLIRSLLNLGGELEHMKLDHGGVIGKRLRHLIEERVASAEALLRATRELSRFDPHGPAAPLKEYARRTGRFGVRAATLYVGLLTAVSIPEMRGIEEELQGLIYEFQELNTAIPALFEEMEDWVIRDVDARISIVLGRIAIYTDEDGNVDPGAVFGAFSGEANPYEAVAERSRRYFGHLLGSDSERDAAIESLLVFPAIGIGALDRPLGPLRTAAGARELLLAAAQVDIAAMQQMVDQTMAEGALVFAANERIRRGFRILRLTQEAGEAIEDDVVKTVLDAYNEQAEGAFRTYGWLLLRAARLCDGVPNEGEDRPPTLGELEQLLRGLRHESIAGFVNGGDSALRNAVAHSQWRWDSEVSEVVDLRSGQRWDIDALTAAGDNLAEATVGVDAGYGCFLATGAVELRAPRWLVEGKEPRAYLPMAQASFGALGFKVLGIRDAGATVVVENPDALERGRLIGPLVGLSSVVRKPDRFRILDPAGVLINDIPAADFREIHEAKETVRDLALIAPLVGDLINRGAPAGEVLRRTLAVQLSLVVQSALPEVTEGGLAASQLLRLADRLQFVLFFIRSRLPDGDDPIRPILRSVSKARALATSASSGAPGALPALSEEMLGLLRWLEGWDGIWPEEDLVPKLG